MMRRTSALHISRNRFVLAVCLVASTIAAPVGGLAQSTAVAQTGSVGQTVSPAQVFDKLLSNQEKEIVDIAEAMPADKFDFVPSDKIGLYGGVSSFSAQVKHLASANYGAVSGFGVPGGKTRADFATVTTRDQILAVLKESYTYDHAAVATITPENAFVTLDAKGTTRAGALAGLLAHNNDHYGQLVEYLRMNGLVPPASRKK